MDTSSSHPKFVRRRRNRHLRQEKILVTAAILTIGMLGATLLDTDDQAPSHRAAMRHLLQDANVSTTAAPAEDKLYPPDVFTSQQLKHGAVVLYVIGIIYMFVALAIVCDEFFVPSLEVIIQILDISEDVAGATFMAAGGSAPEFFTSFIGVFIDHSDVGIGTIVGSAVFNILFVIGMCAMFSLSVLTLTWWPLFRDVSFYSLSLICLICFFRDRKIEWWEALILLLCYVIYVIFMKFNRTIELFVKTNLKRNRVNSTPARSTDNLINDAESPQKQSCQVIPGLKSSSAKFRHGVLQLMIHTIDPLGEAKVHDKAMKLHAIASIQTLDSGENHNNPAQENQNGNNGTAHSTGPGADHNTGHGAIPAISNGVVSGDPAKRDSQQTATTNLGSEDYQNGGPVRQDTMVTAAANNNHCDNDLQRRPSNASDAKSQVGDLEENEPLDLSWPETPRKQLTYIIIAPLIFPMWLTLPDVRRPDRRKYFPWAFVGSILWIAVFSYLLNWWASTTGKVIGIPNTVMGLTFLAAGTSIPDLITSIIVAKKGFGDMAVSSSVGSNIFDVTVGLPVPWLLYAAIYNGQPYTVNSDGLFCSIILLFLMLLFVIVSIAAFKWRLNKSLGACMFVMYVLFLTVSLLLEYNIITCPVNL